MALPAYAMVAFHARVSFVEGVTMNAMGLPGLLGGERVSADTGFSRGYGLKMRGIHASGILTSGIDLEAFWNLANMMFIRESRGLDGFSLFSESPISLWVLVRAPFPASIRNDFDFLHKTIYRGSFLDVAVHHNRGLMLKPFCQMDFHFFHFTAS
jgi:hypothetical protein